MNARFLQFRATHLKTAGLRLLPSQGADQTDAPQEVLHSRIDLIHGIPHAAEAPAALHHIAHNERRHRQNHRKDNPAQARVQSHGVGYAADAQDRRLDANAQGGVYRFGELVTVAGHPGHQRTAPHLIHAALREMKALGKQSPSEIRPKPLGSRPGAEIAHEHAHNAAYGSPGHPAAQL